MTHKTKGIVLRTIQYGETSVITSIYTELFGLQNYIIKGVRKSSKKTQAKQTYFQPGSILQMEVYQNNLKNLQFIKDYEWSYLYQKILFDVVRNAIAQFIIELFQRSIKQPEANPELFYLLEGSLMQADKGTDTVAANLPLYFTLHLATESGFQIQGSYSKSTPVLDLKEGTFVEHVPSHLNYIAGVLSQSASDIQHINFYNDLENIKLNREIRRQLLDALLQFVSHHVTDFKELRSLPILQEVLS
jgi:DNA repair protein RecO (recombination protein O)